MNFEKRNDDAFVASKVRPKRTLNDIFEHSEDIRARARRTVEESKQLIKDAKKYREISAKSWPRVRPAKRDFAS